MTDHECCRMIRVLPCRQDPMTDHGCFMNDPSDSMETLPHDWSLVVACVAVSVAGALVGSCVLHAINDVVLCSSKQLRRTHHKAHMHAMGVLHRDMHLNNILVNASGDLPPHCWIADFGKACHLTLASGDDRSCEGKELCMSGAIGVTSCRPPEIVFECTYDLQGRAQLPYVVRYGAGVDVWAWGTGSLCVASGVNPVSGSNDREAAGDLVSLVGLPCKHLASARSWKMPPGYIYDIYIYIYMYICIYIYVYIYIYYKY